MIITIDGPAGAGKSTVARRLAARLGFEFLDTGAGYRAVALFLQQQGQAASVNDDTLQTLLARMHFTIQLPVYQLNGQDVTQALREPAVSELASQMAERASVRTYLTQWQQAYAQGRNLVTEGRDQGTVVFPKAECKFFLTADATIRLDRRHKELQERGSALSKDELARLQLERDHRDAHRALAPLQPAPDAIVVDSTGLTIDQVVDIMEQQVRQRASAPAPSTVTRS